MDVLTKQDLRSLIEKQRPGLVSIFLPTHRAGREVQQDQIRLKNLLGEAKEKLVAQGRRAPEANRLLQPAQALLADDYFWRHQSDGLVLFVEPDEFRCFRVPLVFDELVIVANRFHIKPLLPLFSSEEAFFVLALSQNVVKLFHGGRDGLEEWAIKDAPAGLADTLRFDEILKQQQFHTKTAPTGGQRSAVFHGQGAGKDREISRLMDYLRQVDRAVNQVLRDQNAPLVVACVEYLFPLYREVNSYAHLFDEEIKGNPEPLKPEELHRRAWEILEPHFRQTMQQTLSTYNQLAGTEQQSHDIRKILPAAYSGQVDTLFVSLEDYRWGWFDLQTDTLQLRSEPEPGVKDLLDAAAVQTLLHNGTVYAVSADRMPDGPPLAAIFRYA